MSAERAKDGRCLFLCSGLTRLAERLIDNSVEKSLALGGV
jgi:hypothetical protein